MACQKSDKGGDETDLKQTIYTTNDCTDTNGQETSQLADTCRLAGEQSFEYDCSLGSTVSPTIVATFATIALVFGTFA